MSLRDLGLGATLGIKCVLVVIALLAGAAAQAALLDCSVNPTAQALAGAECAPVDDTPGTAPVYAVAADTPSVPAVAAQASFQVDQTRRSDTLYNSAPLLILVCAFLIFLLLRAKRFNTK
jgi:hypothetical protein